MSFRAPFLSNFVGPLYSRLSYLMIYFVEHGVSVRLQAAWASRKGVGDGVDAILGQHNNDFYDHFPVYKW